MSDQSHLREALLQVQRGLDVAKLGLNRDGVQHAKIVKLEVIVAEALSAPSAQTLSADEPHWVDKLRGELSYVMDDSEDGSGPGNPEHDNMVEQALCSVREVVEPLLAPAKPALSVESAAGVSIEALQAAHVARQEEWCPDQKPDLSFRGNEMAGEVGEACNVIKKLERERQGWRGSRATVDDLGDELADVIHTAILCSITAGIELGPRVVAKFNATSEKNGLATTIAAAPAPNPSPAAKGILDQHQAIHDEWLEEALNKATPSPQPADVVREALLDARNNGLIYWEPNTERGHTSKALMLARIDAALASDPAPSSPDLEALRAENEAYRNAARDMLNNWRFGNFYAPQQPEPLYVRKFAQLHKAGSDRIASQVIARSQAASDPAPAGEAVEPVAWRWRMAADRVWNYQEDRQRIPDAIHEALYAHPAPEDTARLWEDLERVTRERDTFADICLVVSGHLELPHSESGPCDDSRRYDRELTSLEALYRRTEDERVEHMGKRFKAEAEAETFKRARDDARKALETIAEEASVANEVIRLNRDGRGQGRIRVATAIHRIVQWTTAARSASREGASDE